VRAEVLVVILARLTRTMNVPIGCEAIPRYQASPLLHQPAIFQDSVLPTVLGGETLGAQSD